MNLFFIFNYKNKNMTTVRLCLSANNREGVIGAEASLDTVGFP